MGGGRSSAAVCCAASPCCARHVVRSCRAVVPCPITARPVCSGAVDLAQRAPAVPLCVFVCGLPPAWCVACRCDRVGAIVSVTIVWVRSRRSFSPRPVCRRPSLSLAVVAGAPQGRRPERMADRHSVSFFAKKLTFRGVFFMNVIYFTKWAGCHPLVRSRYAQINPNLFRLAAYLAQLLGQAPTWRGQGCSWRGQHAPPACSARDGCAGLAHSRTFFCGSTAGHVPRAQYGASASKTVRPRSQR